MSQKKAREARETAAPIGPQTMLAIATTTIPADVIDEFGIDAAGAAIRRLLQDVERAGGNPLADTVIKITKNHDTGHTLVEVEAGLK